MHSAVQHDTHSGQTDRQTISSVSHPYLYTPSSGTVTHAHRHTHSIKMLTQTPKNLAHKTQIYKKHPHTHTQLISDQHTHSLSCACMASSHMHTHTETSGRTLYLFIVITWLRLTHREAQPKITHTHTHTHTPDPALLPCCIKGQTAEHKCFSDDCGVDLALNGSEHYSH